MNKQPIVYGFALKRSIKNSFEVYVDSPLAVEATHVFKDNMLECYDEETKALVERDAYGDTSIAK